MKNLPPEYPYLVVEVFDPKVSHTVISRWFGKFKKLTTEKRNLHFIEISVFGKKLRHERILDRVRVTAQEMREFPSKPACRSRLQTTLSCIGKEPFW